MCVKLSPRDLNSGSYPHILQAFILMECSLHQGCTMVYTGGVSAAPRMYNGISLFLIPPLKHKKKLNDLQRKSILNTARNRTIRKINCNENVDPTVYIVTAYIYLLVTRLITYPRYLISSFRVRV